MPETLGALGAIFDPRALMGALMGVARAPVALMGAVGRGLGFGCGSGSAEARASVALRQRASVALRWRPTTIVAVRLRPIFPRSPSRPALPAVSPAEVAEYFAHAYK